VVAAAAASPSTDVPGAAAAGNVQSISDIVLHSPPVTIRDYAVQRVLAENTSLVMNKYAGVCCKWSGHCCTYVVLLPCAYSMCRRKLSIVFEV
jgi:hypothetical protein